MSSKRYSMIKIEYEQSRVIGIKDGVLAWVDKDTGLMWEIKNLDNITMMYVWHTSFVKNLPSTDLDNNKLPYEPKVKDATSYVERLNENQYAGFDDWRLPSYDELTTLIDPEGAYRLIKKPLQENTCAQYWSSSPAQVVSVMTVPGLDIRDTAYIPAINILDFTNAEKVHYNPSNSLWIRCVRSLEKSPKPEISNKTKKELSKRKSQLSSSKLSLFDLLKEQRLELAEEYGVPPYIIFHDSTLEEMAKTRPNDLETMSYISGVGEQKLDKYGNIFLAVIQSSPLPNVLQNNLSDTVNETLTLLNDGLDIDNIAIKRDIKLSTVYTHLADAIEVGLIDAKDTLQLSDSEHSEIINALEIHMDGDMLKPTFDALEGKYDYGILNCVRASLNV